MTDEELGYLRPRMTYSAQDDITHCHQAIDEALARGAEVRRLRLALIGIAGYARNSQLSYVQNLAEAALEDKP